MKLSTIAIVLTMASCAPIHSNTRKDYRAQNMAEYQALEQRARNRQQAERDAAAKRQQQRVTEHERKQQLLEQEKQAEEERRAQIRESEANALLELQKKRNEAKQKVVNQAIKLGYKGVIFDAGLTTVMQSVLDGTDSLEDLQNHVIELDFYEDRQIESFQVPNDSLAFFRSLNLRGIIFILPNHEGAVIQGASITALNKPYFAITGTTHYRTVIGSRQAITIEMVDIDTQNEK